MAPHTSDLSPTDLFLNFGTSIWFCYRDWEQALTQRAGRACETGIPNINDWHLFYSLCVYKVDYCDVRHLSVWRLQLHTETDRCRVSFVQCAFPLMDLCRTSPSKLFSQLSQNQRRW